MAVVAVFVVVIEAVEMILNQKKEVRIKKRKKRGLTIKKNIQVDTGCSHSHSAMVVRR